MIRAYRFYRHAFQLLEDDGIPFLLGGAYALSQYTGITRHTKDIDLFVRKADVERTLKAFAAAGYRGEMFFSHWLAKAFHGEDFLDIIFNSGDGLCPVDDSWFTHAVEAESLGAKVRLVPAEEMIWQKAFIMERERFDGADVNHLLRARGRILDWDRLLARFGAHGRVLLAHLILFGYVYPEERAAIPAKIFEKLYARLDERASLDKRACQGTFLSRTQYLIDIEDWGYTDPRLEPVGSLTKDQVTAWTDAGR